MPLYKSRLILLGLATSALTACELSGGTQKIISPFQDQTTITIKRDTYGTPHIYAKDYYGLFYGYGYSLAEDRLYQLEILKHSTQGRVAEILGKAWIDFDKKHQHLYWPEDVQDQINKLDQTHKDIFLGMANGINARLKTITSDPSNLLPLEFTQNDFKPQAWTSYDVAMLFIGSMLLRYGDFNTELENENFLAELIETHGDKTGRNIFDILNPTDHPLAPTVISKTEWPPVSTGGGKHIISPETIFPIDITNRGHEFSNALVVSNKYLKNDQAVLINGPQFGWYIPAYTYSIGFHMPGWEAVGNAPVGYPLPMFGYNRNISWGTTWGASDNVDIFREQLNPESLDEYKHKGQWKKLHSREITIKVKDSDDVRFTAYKSVHGPITRYEPEKLRAYSKSRGWTGREIDTLIGWIEATQAHDHTSWKTAVSKSGLNVNWYYADRKGNIAYFAGGAYPDRAPGHDNRFSVSGTGEMDWQGIKPASSNPHVLNPISGYIANWNNKPAKGFLNPDEWWYSWMEADRIHILDNLVKAYGKMTSDEVWNLMMDASYIDPNAIYFKKFMLAALESSSQPEYDHITHLLKSWDARFSHSTGSGTHLSSGNTYAHAGNAIFRTWLSHMLTLSLSDDLPGNIGHAISTTTGYGNIASPTAAGLNISVGLKVLNEALNNRTSYDFFNGQNTHELWLKSLDSSLAELTEQLGSDPNDWKLPVPSTRFNTKNFLGIPQARMTEQNDTVQDMNRGTENNMTVFNGDDWPIGYEVVPPGQSGFIAPNGEKTPHYLDQLHLFQTHGKKRVWLNDIDVNANSVKEYKLEISR